MQYQAHGLALTLSSIKSYSLDDLSDEYNPLEEYTDIFIGGYTYTENKVYILYQNFDYTNGDLSPFIRIVDKKTAQTISDIPLHNTLGESSATARIFCVSPDDKYACMVISNNPMNINPDKLIIINLDSGKTTQKTIDWATDDDVYIQ